MDFELLSKSLTKEELEVEYTIRGLTSREEDAKKKLSDLLLAENADPQRKQTKSHVQILDLELDLISTKIDEIDEAWEEIDGDPSIIRRQIVLMRLMHWKERAVRLANSFPQEASLIPMIKTFERNIRSLGRELKRYDAGRLNAPSGDVNHPSTSRVASTSTNVNMQHRVSDQEGDNADFDATFESRFSNKIEEMTEKFLKQLTTSKKPTISQARSSGYKISPRRPVLDESADSDDYSDSSSMPPRKDPVNKTAPTNSQSNERQSGRQAVSSYHPRRREVSSYQSRRRSNPSKWKITFSGREGGRGLDNVQDFIMRLEEHAHQDGIEQQELVNLTRNFVSGTAEKWYYIFLRKNKGISWRRMKKALLERFSSVESERAQRRYVRGRTQEQKESFNDFILDIEMANCRLSHPLPEDEILEIVLDNMNPALKNATQNEDFERLEDLRKVCANYEKLWSTSGYDPRKLVENRPRRTRAIEEITYPTMEDSNRFSDETTNQTNQTIGPGSSSYPNDDEDECHQVNALDRRTMPVICWNCKDLGHTYNKCPVGRTHEFCFGCGLAGKRFADCYKCQKRQSGNFRPNVHHAGEQRSERPNLPRPLQGDANQPGTQDSSV